MALDKELLRKSFVLMMACEPDLTHHFYEVLFTRHPAAKRLFHRRPRQAQEQLLTSTLTALVERIDDAAYLEQTLRPLGAKHAEYGVSAEMYPWVKDALLATLRHVACVVWTPELETTWSEAYDKIAALMLQGAAASSRGRP